MLYRIAEFDPSKTALIVVDMQNDFVEPGAPMHARKAFDARTKVGEAIDIARATDVRAIYTARAAPKSSRR